MDGSECTFCVSSRRWGVNQQWGEEKKTFMRDLNGGRRYEYGMFWIYLFIFVSLLFHVQLLFIISQTIHTLNSVFTQDLLEVAEAIFVHRSDNGLRSHGATHVKWNVLQNGFRRTMFEWTEGLNVNNVLTISSANCYHLKYEIHCG